LTVARLAFLIADLNGGGAERVAVNLIRGFVERGHEVDLIVMQAEGALLPLLPQSVRIFDLNAGRVRNVFRPLIRYLRERRPDAVQVSMWPLTSLAVLALRLSGIRARLVTSDHTTLSRHYAHFGRWRRAIQRLSIALVYPWANARVAVSNRAADDLAQLGGLPRESIDVIHNPVAQAPLHSASPEIEVEWGGEGARILHVGNLNPAKNQKLLLAAFAELAKSRAARLLVIGEGALRDELEQLAHELGISDRVSMPGFILDPSPYYAAADLFVLSSDYEGFASVLVEAMQAGLPIVSTDCESGPREILDGGNFGVLARCGDVKLLASAMAALLDGNVDPEAQKTRAALYSVDAAVERYLEIMLKIAG
jgi:glycosyltransferase involved in cell wall biosynthesis